MDDVVAAAAALTAKQQQQRRQQLETTNSFWGRKLYQDQLTMAYYIDDGMSDVCSVVSGFSNNSNSSTPRSYNGGGQIKLLMTILVPWSAVGLGA